MLEKSMQLPSNDLFKSVICIPLYQSTNANNHGFLAAALRAQIIKRMKAPGKSKLASK